VCPISSAPSTAQAGGGGKAVGTAMVAATAKQTPTIDPTYWMTPDQQMQYNQLREEASKIDEQLQSDRAKFEKYRDNQIREMEAKFTNWVNESRNKYHQAKDKIELLQKQGRRALKYEIKKVLGDPNLSDEEKVAYVHALEESFLKAYYPHDNYQRREMERRLKSMVSKMAGIAGPGLLGLLSGMLGGAPSGCRVVVHHAGPHRMMIMGRSSLASPSAAYVSGDVPAEPEIIGETVAPPSSTIPRSGHVQIEEVD
jgi:Skp family chaperone for outer membrane proteins